MHTKVPDKSTYFFLAFIIVLTAYWIWLGCGQRSITEDEGISFLTAKAILDFGYPLLPSGYIYHRAYLPHYLLAAGTSCLGANEFSLMLPSLLFSLGTVFFLFLIGRDITGSGWLGAAAAVLLASLQIQTFYATGPRMYSALQFFSLLAVYCAYRGFLKSDYRYQVLSVYAVAGAILCHRQGAVLLFAIPASLFILFIFFSRKIKVKFNLGLITAFSVLAAVLFFIYIYEPASSLPVISMGGGEKAEEVNIGISLFRIADHVFQLEHALPLALIWIPLGFFSALCFLKDKNPGYLYLFLVLLISIFSSILILQTPQPRFWYFILPHYSLAACIGIVYGYNSIFSPSRQQYKEAAPKKTDKNTLFLKSRRIQAILLLSFGLLITFFLYLGASIHKQKIPLLDILKKGYGIPSKNPTCHKDIKQFYAALKPLIRPDDEVISTNPWVTYYYLDRINGFLRENKISEGKFSAYISPRDEYFGIKLIDTQTELTETKNTSKRIWMIIDYKFPMYSSPETRFFIENNFIEILDYKYVKAYLNHPE